MRAEARESNDSYWSNLWEGGRERVDREEQRAGEAGRTVRFGFLHLLFLLLRGLAFSICFLVTPSFISEPTLDQKFVIQNKLTLRLWSFFLIMIFLLLTLQNLIQPHPLLEVK